MKKPRVDHESLRAKYPDCDWEREGESYVLRFKSQDGDYWLYGPSSVASRTRVRV